MPATMEQQASQLETLIKSDVSHLNSLSALVDLAATASAAPALAAAADSLQRVFVHLRASDLLVPAATASSPSAPSQLREAREWVAGQYRRAFDSLVARVGSAEASAEMAVLAMDAALNLVPRKGDAAETEQALAAVAAAVVRAHRKAVLRRFADFAAKYSDVLDIALKVVKATSRSDKALASPLFELVEMLPVPEVDGGAKQQSYMRKVMLKAQKGLFVSCWTCVLALDLSEAQTKRALEAVSERVLPMASQPLQLIEFVNSAYNMGGILSVLALKALFSVMIKHNIDVPQFYTQLYALYSREMMASQHRDTLFVLTEKFLSGNYVPAATVASFAKRMARLSLSAPPAASLVVIPLVFNLLRMHKNARVLLEKERLSAFEKDTKDSFLPDETDPLKTDALNSCLWELGLLCNHFAPMVAKMARIFTNVDFEKSPYQIEDFTGLSYHAMISAELDRKAKGTALEFQVKKGPYCDDEAFAGWDIGKEDPMEGVQSADSL
eukprot:m51a1_g11864 hypothetical protein (498) ;mRNA; f:518955-520672